MPSARDPEAIYRVFGRALRKLREHKGVPQQELATLSGLTRSSIANIEKGRQRVLLHQLLHFAAALNVEVSELLPNSADFTRVIEPETQDSKNEYLQRLRTVTADIRGAKSQ